MKEVFSSDKHQLVNSLNPANTSVLPLKKDQKDIVLALCEAGLPFKVQKKDLLSLGFDDFNSIENSFSAHPKVDPETGDIFNFGCNAPSSLVMTRHNANMELIKTSAIKLRNFQAIHDFCLAGDYLIVLEHPIDFSVMSMLFTGSYF